MPGKVSLSFSGGGALGIGYLGFLRVIQEAGIPIDHVVTHSGASLVLNYLGANIPDQDAIKHFSQLRLWKFLDIRSLKMGGIVNLNRMMKHFYRISGGATIESINQFNAAIVVSDITNASKPKEEIITNGLISKYSVISSIVPPIFPLYESDGKIYADGGYTSLYASGFLREKGSPIVGVYPNAFEKTVIPNYARGVARVLKSVMSQREIFENTNTPIDIEIKGFPCNSGLNEFVNSKEIYDAGRKLALKNLSKIQSLI